MNEYIEKNKALAETWKEPRYTDVMNVLTEIRDRIRSLPSEDVQPVVRWIPCSERLPDKCGNYLVTEETAGWNMLVYGTIDIAYFDTVWHKAEKVLAWMPLPEPYQGKRKGVE